MKIFFSYTLKKSRFICRFIKKIKKKISKLTNIDTYIDIWIIMKKNIKIMYIKTYCNQIVFVY